MKEISTKNFNSLTEEKKNDVINELYKLSKYEKIIELLASTKLENLSASLLSMLGGAYNNLNLFYEAMRVLELITEDKRDVKWYYRYGYSCAYKNFPDDSDEIIKAFQMLDKACELSPDDEIKNWCIEIILEMRLQNQLENLKENAPNLYKHYINSNHDNIIDTMGDNYKYSSIISALLIENYKLQDEDFARLDKIEGLKLKYKHLSCDNDGEMIVSYDGLDFVIKFFSKQFLSKSLPNIQAQYFSEEECEQISNAKFSFNFIMNFIGNPQRAYHLQLKIINALIPTMVALYDRSAYTLLNRKWVELATNSNIVPSTNNLYTIHVVTNNDKVWLHTHGLNRCNIHEVEILNSNKENFNTHYTLLTSYADILLNEYNNSLESQDDKNMLTEGDMFNIGIFEDKKPIIATSIPFEEGLKHYPKEILGQTADREGHDIHTNILFLYENENDVKKNRLRKIDEFTKKLNNNPIFYISDKETKRMSDLAKERFSYVEKIFKAGKNINVLIKLGLATIDDEGNIDKENLEHIWFELLFFEDGGFRARLTQEPYYIPNIHAGDEGKYLVSDITDWIIYIDEKTITPDTVYLL